MTDQYYELKQFFGGYFFQDWKEFYEWEGKTPTYVAVIHRYKAEVSGSILTQTIEELQALLAANHEEDELQRIVNRKLWLNLYVPALGMTYRAWLISVLDILKSSEVPPDIVKRKSAGALKKDSLIEVIEANIFIGNSPDDLKAEINENFWRIPMSKEEKKEFSVEDLLSFYTKLIANRSRQIQNEAKHGMIFYTWLDEQASQLRFCLISDFHPKLPFSASIVDASLEEIIEEFLASPDTIPFSEPMQDFKLKVFQRHVP